MRSLRRCPLSRRAQAVALLCGSLAWPLLAPLPARAAIIVTGEASPSTASGVVAGYLFVGTDLGQGNVAVTGSSTLQADALGLGNYRGGGSGALSVSGPAAAIRITGDGALPRNVDIGGQAAGSLSVLNGASFSYGLGSANCPLNCRIWVSNGAGSTGQLLVSGSGSSFNANGQVGIGSAGVSTTWGTPGGQSLGTARVDGGATAASTRLVVGAGSGGNAALGTEFAEGSLVIDGAGSSWNIVRHVSQAGGQGLLAIGSGSNTSGLVTVQNGSALTLNGAASRSDFSGLNIGSGGATAQGRLVVDGGGSRVTLTNALGFINVGTNVAGSLGQLDIRNGGRISGGADSLPFVNVGRDGGTGSLSVSGTDGTGAASLLRLTGTNPNDGGGAVLHIGRTTAIGAGTGSVNVNGGGWIEIDSRADNLANPDALSGMQVGRGVGSTGTLDISGRAALTGASSTVSIQGGAGLAPYVGVGRDGANGTLNLSAGGQLLLGSARASVGAVNTSGNSLVMDIGRNNVGGTLSSIGQVNISGAGSQLALTGTADSILQVGRGSGGAGTLNVSAGGTVRALALTVGTDAGAIGNVNFNGARFDSAGTFTSGTTAGQGGGISVGRNGGVGVLNIANASTVNISSADTRAGLVMGGSASTTGGIGTVNLSGGSTVHISGPQAYVAVGYRGSAAQGGIGTFNLSGAGTALDISGAGANLMIARGSNTSGLLNLGSGARATVSGLVGVAHDGAADTGGTAALLVDGILNATLLINGRAGLLGGEGIVNADVINHGVINPGHSPGTLRLNGNFDNRDGTLIMEIKMLPDGSFITDRLLLNDAAQLQLGAGRISFDFLDGADPNAFLNAGLFDLDSFFQTVDGGGVLHDLSAATKTLFGQSVFTASSALYRFDGFSFDALTGASFNSATAVPLPGSAALALLGLLLLWRSRRSAVGQLRLMRA